jgi:hypothetical protein
VTKLLPKVVVFVAFVFTVAVFLATQLAMKDPDQWPAVVAVINLAAFIAACGTLVLNLNTQWTLKAADVRLSFQKRYEDIEYDFRAKVNAAATPTEQRELARVYYQRFWGLQMDQFEAWLEGLVPDRTYRYWVTLRESSARTTNTVGGVPHEEGRRIAQDSLGSREFEQHFWAFIDKVLSPSKIDDALLYARREWPRVGQSVSRAKTALNAQALVLVVYGLPYFLFPAQTTLWTQ